MIAQIINFFKTKKDLKKNGEQSLKCRKQLRFYMNELNEDKRNIPHHVRANNFNGLPITERK